MATPAEHEALYAQLRADVLGRGFAVTHAFTAYQLADDRLLSAPASPSPSTTVRWTAARGTRRENPGVYGAMLLTALAVESALGNAESTTVLRLAVEALGQLYRQPAHGPFAGYPIRWDAAGARNWRFDGDDPERCGDFLLDEDGTYLWSAPISDPRHRAARPVMRELLTKYQFDEEYVKNDGGGDLWGWEYKAAYRRNEPSMDEICGLVATYGAVHAICTDVAVRTEIETQADKLGKYLATHGYVMVRPTGGLTARGATGMLPALEYPINRALGRLTGNDYSSSADFEAVLRAAGLWDLVAGHIAGAKVGFVLAGPVIGPLMGVLGVFAGLISPFVPGLNAGGAMQAAAAQLDLLDIAGSVALFAHANAFDMWSPGYTSEVGLAHLMKAIESPVLRFGAFLAGLELNSGAISAGFPPLLALGDIDDPDVGVKNAYAMFMLRNRPSAYTPELLGPRSATALATLIQHTHSDLEEKQLVGLLDARYQELENGLPVDTDGDDHSANPGSSEKSAEACDYLAALALAWRHAARRADDGDPVTTSGFPVPPAGFATWPAVGPPLAALTTSAPVRRAVLGNAPVPTTSDPFPVFANPRPRSTFAAAPVPPKPVATAWDLTYEVVPNGHDLFTGIELVDGDVIEITAAGKVSSGALLAGDTGPDGYAGRVDDYRYPLHSGIDRTKALDHALVARLANYFAVGSSFGPWRFFYHHPIPLYLRVNRLSGTGTGAFIVRVVIKGPPRPITTAEVPGSVIDCVERKLPKKPSGADPNTRPIVAVGGTHADGTRWKASVESVAEHVLRHQHPLRVVRGGRSTRVTAARSKRGRAYLRTVNNDRSVDNLRNLPSC